MEMKDTDAELDAESKSPMGPAPDDDKSEKSDAGLDSSGDADNGKSTWWLWIVVFLVGLAIGVAGSMLLF